MRNWDHLLTQSALSVKDYVRNHGGSKSGCDSRQLEDVRSSMLQAVSEMEPVLPNELLEVRQAIMKAQDAKALWHLQCKLLGWMEKIHTGYFSYHKHPLVTK